MKELEIIICGPSMYNEPSHVDGRFNWNIGSIDLPPLKYVAVYHILCCFIQYKELIKLS